MYTYMYAHANQGKRSCLAVLALAQPTAQPVRNRIAPPLQLEEG